MILSGVKEKVTSQNVKDYNDDINQNRDFKRLLKNLLTTSNPEAINRILTNLNKLSQMKIDRYLKYHEEGSDAKFMDHGGARLIHRFRLLLQIQKVFGFEFKCFPDSGANVNLHRCYLAAERLLSREELDRASLENDDTHLVILQEVDDDASEAERTDGDDATVVDGELTDNNSEFSEGDLELSEVDLEFLEEELGQKRRGMLCA